MPAIGDGQEDVFAVDPCIVVKGGDPMTTTATNTAYCVKCRGMKEIVHPQQISLKNGRSALQGTCPTCGTKLTRILPKGRD
jgi:hypothetical protein